MDIRDALATFALNDAAQYIAQDNPAAAKALVKHVKKSVAGFPAFRRSDGRDELKARANSFREDIPTSSLTA